MDFDSFQRAGGDVSRETFHDLQEFADLLIKWNRKINLVSPATIPEMWSRHILDSLQLAALRPEGATSWCDLGSGGGFPGLIVAIAAKGQGLHVSLVESDLRKATFLRTVIRQLKLDATVYSERIEALEPLAAQVVSARALAPLAQLLEYQARHSAPDGIGIYLKGASAEVELAEALEHWRFNCDKVASMTSVGSHVLKIGDLKRA